MNAPNPPYSSFFDITMRSFIANGCTIKSLIASFDAIRTMAKTRMKLILNYLFILFLANGRKFLNEQYHLSPLSQINNADDGQQLVDVFRSLMPVG